MENYGSNKEYFSMPSKRCGFFMLPGHHDSPNLSAWEFIL